MDINACFEYSPYLYLTLSKKSINTFLYGTHSNLRLSCEVDYSKSEPITFRDNICEEKGLILWKLPPGRIKLNLIDDTRILVNNALILLYINSYDFLEFDIENRGVFRVFCVACLKILRRYQRINRQRGFYYEVTIKEILERCYKDYITRENILYDMVMQTQRNTNRKTITVGNLSMKEKVSISKRKFTDEEIDFVRFLKGQDYSITEITELFKKRYDKTISRGKVSSIKLG